MKYDILLPCGLFHRTFNKSQWTAHQVDCKECGLMEFDALVTVLQDAIRTYTKYITTYRNLCMFEDYYDTENMLKTSRETLRATSGGFALFKSFQTHKKIPNLPKMCENLKLATSSIQTIATHLDAIQQKIAKESNAILNTQTMIHQAVNSIAAVVGIMHVYYMKEDHSIGINGFHDTLMVEDTFHPEIASLFIEYLFDYDDDLHATGDITTSSIHLHIRMSKMSKMMSINVYLPYGLWMCFSRCFQLHYEAILHAEVIHALPFQIPTSILLSYVISDFCQTLSAIVILLTDVWNQEERIIECMKAFIDKACLLKKNKKKIKKNYVHNRCY